MNVIVEPKCFKCRRTLASVRVWLGVFVCGNAACLLEAQRRSTT